MPAVIVARAMNALHISMYSLTDREELDISLSSILVDYATHYSVLDFLLCF